MAYTCSVRIAPGLNAPLGNWSQFRGGGPSGFTAIGLSEQHWGKPSLNSRCLMQKTFAPDPTRECRAFCGIICAL